MVGFNAILALALRMWPICALTVGNLHGAPTWAAAGSNCTQEVWCTFKQPTVKGERGGRIAKSDRTDSCQDRGGGDRRDTADFPGSERRSPDGTRGRRILNPNAGLRHGGRERWPTGCDAYRHRTRRHAPGPPPSGISIVHRGLGRPANHARSWRSRCQSKWY